MKNKLDIKASPEFTKILDSSEKWLKNIYMIENVFDKDFGDKEKQHVKFDFDLNAWLNDEKKSIKSYIKECEYAFSPDVKKLKFVKREIDIMTTSKSTPSIALGRYLMQQAARSFDVFEKKYSKIS